MLLLLASGTFASAAAAGSHDAKGRAQNAQQAGYKPASAHNPEQAANEFDAQAEEQLFVLANQARREAGAPPLTLDSGLTQAARAHAKVMLSEQQLSHQFDGEPALPQRLAIATQLLLDEEAENVALDSGPEQGHQHLLHSPPHRANLLNPSYNVVGLGVVRSGDRLYIVQDFGHSLPEYSETELKDRIAASVIQTRRDAHQGEMQRRDLLIADQIACSMAQADKLGTPEVHRLAERFTVLTYNGSYPETLPDSAVHVLSSRDLHSFSIGACFARTDAYPLGVYWVVLSLQ